MSPRIPGGNDVGLGSARYDKSVSTPALGRPVPKEVGPARQVNKLDVVQDQAAPLSRIEPVLPNGNGAESVVHGLDSLSRHAEQLAIAQQTEVRKVAKTKEQTGLLVMLGDQKTVYRQDVLDILNNPEMTDADKHAAIKKREGDFLAFPETVTKDPELQLLATREVTGEISSLQVHAQNVFIKNKQDGIKADLEARTNQIILDAASTGNIDGALLNHAVLQGAYSSAGLTNAHFVDEHLKLEQTLLQNDIMGHLKSTDMKSGQPALDAVNSLLGRLTEMDDQNVPKNWTRLNPAQRNSDIATVINAKNRIETDMQKGADSLKSQFTEGMKLYTDALQNGDVISPNFSVDLHNMAQSLGPIALLQLKSEEQKHGPGFRAAESAKDPLFGTGVRPISFQDMATPEALQRKMAENIKMGRMVKDAKGLTFVPVLRTADMEGIAKTVEASPMNGIRMIDTLGQALGKDGKASLMVIAGQMANSEDQAAPAVAAVIYNVAKGDMATAQSVAYGMETIRNKAITMPEETYLRDGFNQQIGDAMSENSANRGLNFAVYKTVYAGIAARKNIVDGRFDKDTSEAAFKRVVGSVTKWNGSSVLVPERMNESDFRDYLNNITPETVQMWGGVHGMTNEKAADFIKEDARLRAVSPGRFVVEYEGRQMLTSDGKRFIIDVNTPIIKPKESDNGVKSFLNTLPTGL